MPPSSRLAVEIWAPLPPAPSGVADYVEEQLEFLSDDLELTLVAENPGAVSAHLQARHRVVSPIESDPERLRVYHVGNSPLHAYIHDAAVRVPGVVVLHEWNLHELLLGFAVKLKNFEVYRRQMRREHGERGSIAAETTASALGGDHWTSVFPLNREILESALAVVSLSGSTVTKVAARIPGLPVLHLPHHALLKSTTSSRAEARAQLGFDESAQIILAPGLQTVSKSIDVARAAIESIRSRLPNAVLVSVGGGSTEGRDVNQSERAMGRVSLETLGDALLAADVVLAMRFPSRGETSGVLMRALAAGRACVVSSGSTADEDLPAGVVARVNPGVEEAGELAAVLTCLLTDDHARKRMERLATATSRTRLVRPLTKTLADFLRLVETQRSALESAIRLRVSMGLRVGANIRDEIDRAASSLGLAYVPPSVFERLSSL